MTLMAIGWAYDALDQTQKKLINDTNLAIQLCVYNSAEHQNYQKAVDASVQIENENLAKELRAPAVSRTMAFDDSDEK